LNSPSPYTPTAVPVDDVVDPAALSRVEYRNTYWDYLLFVMSHQFLSLPIQLFFALIGLLIFYAETQGRSGLFGSIAVALFFYTGMWAVQLGFTALQLISKSNHQILTKHVIELREKGFYESTAYGEHLYYWAGLVKAVRRPGMIAIYITQHTAHIVPRRAFATSEEAKAFLMAVRARLAEANGE
jgi:hypothetical protein